MMAFQKELDATNQHDIKSVIGCRVCPYASSGMATVAIYGVIAM